MMKKKIDYSVNDICDYYGDIIEESVKNGLFEKKGEVILLINVMLHCGVDINDYNKVIFLLEKASLIKKSNVTDIRDEDYWLKKVDYQTFIYALLRRYFSEENKDYVNKYGNDSMYELDDKYKLHYLKVRKKKNN